jgi:hypothetical protein
MQNRAGKRQLETDKRVLPHMPVSTEERAGNLIEARVARGRMSVQIVAFPQRGVMRCPGVLDLLDAAVREGADLVGGTDPLEIDRDPKGQLDGIFAIAAWHGVGLALRVSDRRTDG